MPTNRFPGVGKKTYGRDFNFFQKLNVIATGFGSDSVDGYQPDMAITFPTTGITFLNEGTGVIEYSFNGNTVHGELNSASASAGMSFDNRHVSLIWFRVKAGSSPGIVVRVDAW